jgi:flagellar basal body-associated protein FliL
MTTKNNTNSDSSVIDKKKEETKNEISKSVGSYWSLIIIIIISLVLIIFYFCISSAILYSCKVSQSNIIPTSMDCFPFTRVKPDIQEIYTNIFITNTDPQESVKLKFPYNDKNSKNLILDAFRNYKNSPKANSIVIYIISILEGLINYNNNAIDLFLNLLNKAPETLIVLIGPVLYIIYLAIVQIFGFFVSIYYYFISMSWFFKINTNTDGNSKPKWENTSILDPIKYGFSIFFVFVFFILFWVLLFTCFPILPIITLYICVFSILGYVGQINGKDADIVSVTKTFFNYYKFIITSIIAIVITILTFTSSLGVIGGMISLLVIALIYFNIIPLGVFNNIKPENLTQITSFDQAKKDCNGVTKNNGLKIPFVGNLFSSQKGGNIMKDLKKLSKKIRNI